MQMNKRAGTGSKDCHGLLLPLDREKQRAVAGVSVAVPARGGPYLEPRRSPEVLLDMGIHFPLISSHEEVRIDGERP